MDPVHCQGHRPAAPDLVHGIDIGANSALRLYRLERRIGRGGMGCRSIAPAEIDGVLFLAMRLIVGEDLATLVKREGRLPAARAVAIVAQVAGALDAAHERQLVHRDVKPANVLLGRDQRAYLGDFGVAMDQRRAHSHTASGLIVGTADYIAPEQVRDGPIGPWTDVYALGCVLFFLLTGRVVFPLRTSEQRLWAHVVEDPPHVTALREELPEALDGVLARALAKSTEDRWQSAGALADAARAAIESEQPTLGNALPVTRYAKSGTINIAYQVIGDGPRDVVLVPGWISHVEHAWENPDLASFLRRLASTSRLIAFAKRGTGLSDRPERVPDVEERMDDIAAVMAAVGSERAALFGLSEGGAISSLFAATYPHAVSALVMHAERQMHTDRRLSVGIYARAGDLDVHRLHRALLGQRRRPRGVQSERGRRPRGQALVREGRTPRREPRRGVGAVDHRHRDGRARRGARRPGAVAGQSTAPATGSSPSTGSSPQ